MKAKHLIAAYILFWAAGNTQAADTLKLEHTFDGYYMPYNMELKENPGDKCFYPYLQHFSDGSVSIKTYNEDYSIREDINVSFNIPSGYYPNALSYSPGFEMSDGTKFFVVVFYSHEIPYKSPDYCKVNAYNAKTGKLITTLLRTEEMATVSPALLSINGKKSLIILEAVTVKGEADYKTNIYSFADVPNSVKTIPSDPNAPVVPVITVDLTGRPVSEPMPGTITVTRMSDGSTVKKMN